jgi:hypothetical protein
MGLVRFVKGVRKSYQLHLQNYVHVSFNEFCFLDAVLDVLINWGFFSNALSDEIRVKGVF